MSASEQWSCSMCTFVNAAESTECEICESKRADNNQSVEEKKWSCSMCTFINTVQSKKCSMCDTDKPDTDNLSQQHSIVEYNIIYILFIYIINMTVLYMLKPKGRRL